MEDVNAVGPVEMADAKTFLAELMAGGGWSFLYDSELPMADWPVKKQSGKEQDGVIAHRVVRRDPKSGLEVELEIKEYTRYPVVEWGLRFGNTSKRKTPMLEAIRSLDTTVALGKLPYLNYWNGDYSVIDGYEPFRVSLAHGEEYRFAPVGGRPTNRAWPYYNLECPGDGRGLIVVIGWPGQWQSLFQGQRDGAVHMEAGQQITHFRLLPGEEVRTPLSVLLFYRGDALRGQNVWRRWMVEHNMPRPGGKLPEPLLPAYTGRYFAEMALATEETQIEFLDRYVEEGIKLDYWWMDAGWYPCDGHWKNTGTWEPDAKRFPRGLRAVCDHAHAKGIKTLVWFEPERVTPGSWLDKKHPEWLLSEIKEDSRKWPKKCAWASALDLGNPAALKWLCDHTTKLLREQGIDLYRQDHNFDPLPFWRATDKRDRQGITENHYVEGYLAFWKTLRKRFPNMLIDSCASGGRRNDLETLRLSVPLHKTDYDYADNATKQAFHHSMSSWIPFYGAYVLPVETVDTYAFRSSLAPMTMLTYDLRRTDVNWAKLKELTEEWRRVTSTAYFYGDYYPLTPYNRDETQWIAWQHNLAASDGGLVQAYRRAQCPVETIMLRLHGLDPEAMYSVTNLDLPGEAQTFSGRVLMDAGLAVTSTEKPQAVLVAYRRNGSEEAAEPAGNRAGLGLW